MVKLARTLSLLALLTASPTLAAQCGGDFGQFKAAMAAEAKAQGLPAAAIDKFFAGAKQDSRILRADRAQGVFQKTFADFSNSVISKGRMNSGLANSKKFDATFRRIEQSYGIPRGVILAFWALETDFGGYQGDFNTRDALVTLAHDCRRPQLFQPQVLAGIKLTAQGDFDPARTTGAWAGEIGQVQMLPADILENGVDGDGDGHVNLKGSSVDALMSGAKMLSSLGWRAGQPWMQEVAMPAEFDWSKTGLTTELSGAQWQKMGVKPRGGQIAQGLKGSILLPMGRKGPAFLVYPNYRVLFEWNQSFVYVTTASYFATRLSGAKPFTLGAPEAPLTPSQIKALQIKLQARGYDVGKLDGILGEKSREAVQKEQARLGMPADAWPTIKLLEAL